MTLNAQIIEKNGKKEFAVLPYKEFLKLQAAVDDYEDLQCLRAAKTAEAHAASIGLDELKLQLEKRSRRRK